MGPRVSPTADQKNSCPTLQMAISYVQPPGRAFCGVIIRLREGHRWRRLDIRQFYTPNRCINLDEAEAVDISHESVKLETLCRNFRTATRELGPNGAKKLSARLADLKAARNVSELIAGRPHPLERERYGRYALDLAGGQRLVFRPDHDPIPSRPGGGIAWENVTRVTIVFVGNYHD
jgi:proteic killer suppression protein